jgi:hypothetical protein
MADTSVTLPGRLIKSSARAAREARARIFGNFDKTTRSKMQGKALSFSKSVPAMLISSSIGYGPMFPMGRRPIFSGSARKW